MELITKNEMEVVHKEKIEYVDKKTGEIKQLFKLYANDKVTGIQEQILVSEKDFNKINKGDKGAFVYDKTSYGCYLKGITAKA